MKLKFFLWALLTTSCLVAMPSKAAVFGTYSFVVPTGTVDSTEDIPIWTRLWLDPLSDPLIYTWDGRDAFFGVNPNDVPATGFTHTGEELAFDDYTGVYTSMSGVLLCANSVSACTYESAAYSYTPWFSTHSPLHYKGTLNPGSAKLFNIGHLTPIGGSAPAGDYTLENVFWTLTLRGVSYGEPYGINDEPTDRHLEADVYRFTSDCPEANCTFSRTVVSAVPLPGAAWLLGSALIGLGAVKRRKA